MVGSFSWSECFNMQKLACSQSQYCSTYCTCAKVCKIKSLYPLYIYQVMPYCFYCQTHMSFLLSILKTGHFVSLTTINTVWNGLSKEYIISQLNYASQRKYFTANKTWSWSWPLLCIKPFGDLSKQSQIHLKTPWPLEYYNTTLFPETYGLQASWKIINKK